MNFADSDELCRHIRSINGDRVILSFSMGKDAIASYLQLKRHFERKELTPLRLPRAVYRHRHAASKRVSLPDAGCDPVVAANKPHPVIDRLQIGTWHRQVVEERETVGRLIHAVAQHAKKRRPGTAVDLLIEHVLESLEFAIYKAEPGDNVQVKQFDVVFDWKIDRLVDEIERSGIKLPVDYEMFGRSFDGIDYHYLAPIKERFPEDYEKILYWFPLAELDEVRRGLR